MRSTFKITFYVNKGKEKNGVAPVFNIFPKSAENLLITQLYKGFGLTVETIKKLFTGEAVTVTGKLHPAVHNRNFNIQDGQTATTQRAGRPS